MGVGEDFGVGEGVRVRLTTTLFSEVAVGLGAGSSPLEPPNAANDTPAVTMTALRPPPTARRAGRLPGLKNFRNII